MSENMQDVERIVPPTQTHISKIQIKNRSDIDKVFPSFAGQFKNKTEFILFVCDRSKMQSKQLGKNGEFNFVKYNMVTKDKKALVAILSKDKFIHALYATESPTKLKSGIEKLTQLFEIDPSVAGFVADYISNYNLDNVSATRLTEDTIAISKEENKSNEQKAKLDAKNDAKTTAQDKNGKEANHDEKAESKTKTLNAQAPEYVPHPFPSIPRKHLDSIIEEKEESDDDVKDEETETCLIVSDCTLLMLLNRLKDMLKQRNIYCSTIDRLCCMIKKRIFCNELDHNKTKISSICIRRNNSPDYEKIKTPKPIVRIPKAEMNDIFNRVKVPFRKEYVMPYMNALIHRILENTKNWDEILIDFGFTDNETGEKLYYTVVQKKCNGFMYTLQKKLNVPNVNNECPLIDHTVISLESLLDALGKCIWRDQPGYVLKQNRIRTSVILTKERLKKICEQNKGPHLIPIISDNDQNRSNYAWLIQIDKHIAVGISLELNNEKDILVNGIYPNKDYLLQQHILANPKHMGQCKCLDAYEFGADDVQVSNTDFWFNKVKDFGKRFG